MSKALNSLKQQIDTWLSMQLVDCPQPANHSYYIPLIGRSKPLRSIEYLLESIINQSEWSWAVERSLDDLGIYFKLPKGWWKDREGLGAWLLNTIAATFADAWIYYQWLGENEPNIKDSYMEFFALTVMHPEWVKALEAQWIHYPSVGGNMYDVLPTPGDYIYPANGKGTTWQPSYKSKIGKELNRRKSDSYFWLQNVFTSSKFDRAKQLEEGLNHISLATIKGDEEFFITLGKALSEEYKPCQELTLEKIQQQPITKSRGKVTSRQWIRRFWISRGFWLMPSHLLQQEPFNMSDTTINELKGKRYVKGESRSQNDGLFLSESLWFNEWYDSSQAISLTKEGKKMLRSYKDKGMPWAIVSEDME